MKGWGAGSRIKKHDEKTLGVKINSRWEMKKGSRDRKPGEGEREERWRRECADANHIIGLTAGDGVVLLLGGTCVLGREGGVYGVNVEVTEEMQSDIKAPINLTVQHLTKALI